jgi:hypothetical protein
MNKTSSGSSKKIAPTKKPSISNTLRSAQKGDNIASLPVDQIPLSYKEKTIVDNLYPPLEEAEERGEEEEVVEDVIRPDTPPLHQQPLQPQPPPPQPQSSKLGIREVALSVVLFVILNVPLMDTYVFKFVENPYYRTLLKAAIFALVFFMVVRFVL